MVRLNSDYRVPDSADARLNELAEILARATLRMVTKKTGSDSENRLEVCSKTRLNVTELDRYEEDEVT